MAMAMATSSTVAAIVCARREFGAAIRLPLFATFREISILMYAKRVIIPGHVPGETGS